MLPNSSFDILPISKHTFPKEHQAQDQALNNTYSDTHLTHPLQVPEEKCISISYVHLFCKNVKKNKSVLFLVVLNRWYFS